MRPVPPETDSVEYRLKIAARPETVFAYFTDPEKMVRWLGEEATLDPRPGGVCRIVFRLSEARVAAAAATFLGRERDSKLAERSDLGVMTGEYVEVDPYRRIAFSWGWELELLAVPPQST